MTTTRDALERFIVFMNVHREATPAAALSSLCTAFMCVEAKQSGADLDELLDLIRNAWLGMEIEGEPLGASTKNAHRARTRENLMHHLDTVEVKLLAMCTVMASTVDDAAPSSWSDANAPPVKQALEVLAKSARSVSTRDAAREVLGRLSDERHWR